MRCPNCKKKFDNLSDHSWSVKLKMSLWTCKNCKKTYKDNSSAGVESSMLFPWLLPIFLILFFSVEKVFNLIGLPDYSIYIVITIGFFIYIYFKYHQLIELTDEEKRNL